MDGNNISALNPDGRGGGATPWLYADTAYTGKISNDKGINPVIFIQGIKGFFISFYFLRVQAVHMGGESSQLFTGGKVVCNMYAVKTSGFHSNDEIFQRMIFHL